MMYLIYQGSIIEWIKAAYEVAKEKSPCLIWFDELDDIDGLKQEEMRQFMELFARFRQELENSDHKVILIASSNYPWNLGSELFGAFQEKIEFKGPVFEERKELIYKLIENKGHYLDDEEIAQLA